MADPAFLPPCAQECGPRFELKAYQIKLGTLDQDHAENEWVLRSYTRSAKRAKLSAAEGAAEGGGDATPAGFAPSSGAAPKVVVAAGAGADRRGQKGGGRQQSARGRGGRGAGSKRR